MTHLEAFKLRLRNFFRDRKRVLHLVIPILVGVAYYFFVRLTGIGIKCIFHELTGLYCPGCGMTHFVFDLLGFRFRELPGDNLAFLVLAPFWVVFLTIAAFRIPDGKKWHRTKYVTVLAIVSIVIFLIFGVIRNVPGFEFLRPA